MVELRSKTRIGASYKSTDELKLQVNFPPSSVVAVAAFEGGSHSMPRTLLLLVLVASRASPFPFHHRHARLNPEMIICLASLTGLSVPVRMRIVTIPELAQPFGYGASRRRLGRYRKSRFLHPCFDFDDENDVKG